MFIKNNYVYIYINSETILKRCKEHRSEEILWKFKSGIFCIKETMRSKWHGAALQIQSTIILIISTSLNNERYTRRKRLECHKEAPTNKNKMKTPSLIVNYFGPHRWTQRTVNKKRNAAFRTCGIFVLPFAERPDANVLFVARTALTICFGKGTRVALEPIFRKSCGSRCRCVHARPLLRHVINREGEMSINVEKRNCIKDRH